MTTWKASVLLTSAGTGGEFHPSSLVRFSVKDEISSPALLSPQHTYLEVAVKGISLTRTDCT